MKAISEPNNSSTSYYFDVSQNCVFALTSIDNNFIPCYRNNITSQNEELKKIFNNEIDKVVNSRSDILILPRLSLSEKKSFLNSFTSKVNEINIKNKLLLEVDSFSDKENFNFKSNLKELSNRLAFLFEIEKANYLSTQIKNMYEPLGVTELVNIIW